MKNRKPFTPSHTPTPYFIERRDNMRLLTSRPLYDAMKRGEDVTHTVVANIGCGPLTDADAAFIVRACNAHDALVEALSAALDVVADFAEIAPRDDPCEKERAVYEQGTAALKLARTREAAA